MRIKKIELIGFKSFADRTEIHLNPGVTCIVGPNGCGKSNISDALRWVFGERSAKLLRGSRMEDVIFSGTEFRKPLGMAEVSLTLDNQDHVLPIEYDEVVLTRRLNRSGQSEYFINRTPCRLKDILDLILDTGMGSNSYSMIEQGRVDSVINADPVERRFLIEEAAGISKYKVKKEEALRKLERTEQNLLRIRDIVSEVKKNIQYAEKQARRAERYKTQFEELKKLEIQKALSDLAKLYQDKQVKETKKQELLDSQSQGERELEGILKNEKQQKELLGAITSTETAEAARFFECKSEVQSLTQKREFNRERLQSFQHRLIEIKKEREILESQLIHLEKEIQNKSQETLGMDETHRKAEEDFEKEKSQFEVKETWLKERKNAAERLKELLFEKASESVRIRNEAHRLKILLERMGHEQLKRADVLKKLQVDRKTLEERRLIHREGLVHSKQERPSEETRLQTIRENLLKARSRISALEGELAEKKLKHQEAVSRIELLKELSESSEAGERNLLISLSKSPLQGKLVKSLREVLQVESGFEAAVEAVLGTFAQALVAEDVETAKGLMQEMNKVHMGPCGIFIQSLAKPEGKKSGKRPFSHAKINQALEETVIIQKGFEPLFQRLFENVYVVEDFSPEHLEELLPLTHTVRLVTKEGILLGPEARIFFRNGRLSQDQGLFKRQAQIQTLQSAVDLLSGEIESLNKAKSELEREASQWDKERARLETQGRDILIRSEAAESLLQSLEERLQTIRQEFEVLQAEEAEAQNEITVKKNLLKEMESTLVRLETEEKELQSQQKKIEEEVLFLQQEKEDGIHTLSRLKALLENHQTRLQTVAESEAILKNQIQNTRQRLLHLGEEVQEGSKRKEEISSEEGVLEEKLKERVEFQRRSEQALSEIRGRKAFQEEKYQEFLAQLREREDRLKEVRRQIHEEEMKIMELSYREKSVFERMEQTYHVKLSEFEKQLDSEKLEDEFQLEESIKSLKEKVDAFGPVNLLAVDEYEELKQRHEFLSSQEKDLCGAREALLEAIRKINRTTKTLFTDTFAKAQTLFQEYYQTLFGGGHAELTLIPSEEEEEGVDIMVRPPGKKLQHISLLSGGEKALTAVALLFALFRIRPSPLCVLDEVDAPLDEANVDRFIAVLRTFLENTQFLIVTHNRKTIAMGDFLYGVTMEESGVSKIVSVKVTQMEEKEKQVALHA